MCEENLRSEKNHLVIAIVSPLGTPNRKAFEAAVESFCQCNEKNLSLAFASIKITETSLFQEFREHAGATVKATSDQIQAIDLKIKAGDNARNDSKDCAICLKKALKENNFYEHDKITVVNQLKHQSEWDYLVSTYGEAHTLLIGLYSSEKNREHHLQSVTSDKSSDNIALIKKLLVKDQYGFKERDSQGNRADYSQQTGRFFDQAHAFIDMDGSTEYIQKQTRRILELVYGNNIRNSPTRDEYCMALASIACYRSAELGRQVGAVIASEEGDILAVAPNDVTHFGGTTYFDSLEGALKEDNREKARAQDYGKRKLAGIKEQFGSQYEALDANSKDCIDNLIEFIRATHAEEQAITTAARLGISIKGSIVYTTSYPCHHCARKIISAGMKEVVFISPYPKSLALDMFHSEITHEADSKHTKVWFHSFCGVAPKLYNKVFKMREQKYNDDGEVNAWRQKLIL